MIDCDDYIKTLILVGIHPLKPFSFFKITCIFLDYIFGMFCFLRGLFYAQSPDILCTIVESFATTYQGFFKMMTLMVHKKTITNVIEEIKTFWSCEKFGNEAREDIASNHKLIKTMFRCYQFINVVSVSFYVFKPLIFGDPYAMHLVALCDVKGAFCYWSHSVMTFIACSAISPILLGFDGFFLVAFVYCYCEFKQINYAFKAIDSIRNFDAKCMELRAIIKHHCKILRILNDVDGVIGLAIINQFLATIATICVELFVISYSQDIADDMTKFFVIIFCLAEMGLYCWAGSLLYNQSLEVANGAYNTNWYLEENKRIPFGIGFVIERSQKPAKFTIGGFADLNLETFTEVLKMCMSFYTCMQAMLGQKEK